MESKMLESGHEAKTLEGELEAITKDFQGYQHGLVRLTPGRWFFPSRYTKFADKLYNFKWRESDVVVMTYPKCGTTWAQEIVWTMRENPDLLNPRAADSLFDRIPFIESDMFHPEDITPESPILKIFPTFAKLCPEADPNEGISLQLSEALPDPRTIKTHLPFSLLHPSLLDTTKMVYVVRNPMAVAVSYFHHSRLFLDINFKESLEKFVKYFMADDVAYGPYWEHLKEAWQRRHHPNLHLVYYEDLKDDIKSELRRLNTFLATDLTQYQLDKIAQYTSFDQMKARDLKISAFTNKDVVKTDGGFFRKGESKDWKTKLTPELKAEMAAWMEDKFNFGIQFE